MDVFRTFAHGGEAGVEASGIGGKADAAAVMGAVRDDIRQTLRVGWIDPAIEAAAANPVFFTAAWSAIRPNVGKSFLLLARALRNQAVEPVQAADPPGIRSRLSGELSEEELRRLEDAMRAAHLVSAKVQIVVHALYRAARRERVPGTGREEPPVRRGVPEWQRWMSLQAPADGARACLEEATRGLTLPAPPVPLRLLARWPPALAAVWNALSVFSRTEAWTAAATRLRRTTMSGISSLPHAVELQWAALKARGFSEEDRLRLVEVLAEHDASAPVHTLTAGFAWWVTGAPEIGLEA